MRIGQAIDEIIQDEEKQFEGKLDGFRYEITCVNGEVETLAENIRNGEKKVLYGIPLARISKEVNWELVQKPVTFMEAVESGKPFRPESWRDNTEMELDDFMYDISSHSNEGIREYLLGKFYIKEDN